MNSAKIVGIAGKYLRGHGISLADCEWICEKQPDRLHALSAVLRSRLVRVDSSDSERNSQAQGDASGHAKAQAGHDNGGGSADEAEPSPDGEPSPQISGFGHSIHRDEKDGV